MRRLLGGLRARILLSAAIGALVVVGPVVIFMLAKVHLEVLKGQLRSPDLLSRAEIKACEANPTTFEVSRAPFLIHAYDRATLKSANPSAGSLNPLLLNRLFKGEQTPLLHYRKRPKLFVAEGLRQLGKHGPCSLLRVRVRHLPTIGNRLRNIWIAGATLAVAFTMAISMFLAVRPLVRRLRRLRESAVEVGDPGFNSPEDNKDDDISRIAEALTLAHDRIQAHTAQLTEQRQILADHLANVAHDLRTPIASLQLALEQAESQAADADSASVLTRALDDTVYLAALIENLHLASQLRGGADPFDPDALTDLSEVAAQVARRFEVLGRRNGVELVYAVPDEPLIVRCDPAMAQQALSNVVQNAVTHGEHGGHVALVLDLDGSGGFHLSVSDDGPGVPPDELPKLVGRTFRADAARQRDPRGGGLGLAITNEICTRSNWAVGFSRRDPRGLEVTISGRLSTESSKAGG